MEQDTHWTPIIFRMHQGEVLALFVQELGTNDPYTCAFYAHVGQHGTLDPMDIIRDSRPARSEEYRDLYDELQRIGYRIALRERHSPYDLEVRKQKLEEFYAQP